MRTAPVLGALTLSFVFVAACGKPNVTFRRVSIEKPKEKEGGAVAGAIKKPGQRRAGLQPAAYMLVGNDLRRVTEPGPNAIEAGKHYVSIALEEVKIHGGGLVKPLVLTFKVEGALPGGDTFTAILARTKKSLLDGPYYRFPKSVVVDPFVYKGQPLLVDVSLSTVDAGFAAKVEEAKKKWGDVRHIDPNDLQRHPVDAAPLSSEGSEWIGAQFATKVSANALPLVAGKYVVFSHPKPEELKDKVTFDERGLVWKDGGEPVSGVSFITFYLNRRSRGPRRDTLVEQMKKTIETSITNNQFDSAKGAMEKLPAMIDNDKTITDTEKAFNKELIAIYNLRIERKQAKAANDAATLKSKSDDLVKAIDDFKKKYKDMIEPSEVNDLNFKLRKYLRERE